LVEAGISRIYFTDNDGGISLREDDAVVQITPGGDPAFPVLSPTADRLVFERRGERPSVGVIGTDGRDSWVIRPEGGARSLVWSLGRDAFSVLHAGGPIPTLHEKT
jgi:hypothetical protein